MLNLYEAIVELKQSMEGNFVLAGFVDGGSLTVAKVKTETNPMFWFLQATSVEGSGKSMYIVYGINSIEPNAYGDGEILRRKAVTTVSLYSRKKNIDAQFKILNDVFIAQYSNFELGSIYYNQTESMYVYDFVVEMYIYG